MFVSATKIIGITLLVAVAPGLAVDQTQASRCAPSPTVSQNQKLFKVLTGVATWSWGATLLYHISLGPDMTLALDCCFVLLQHSSAQSGHARRATHSGSRQPRMRLRLVYH